jgi:hypothetical protein
MKNDVNEAINSDTWHKKRRCFCIDHNDLDNHPNLYIM